MAKSLIAGSRELKTRLRQYLNRVLATALRKLAARGTVTPPTRMAATDFTPIRSRDGSASAAVSADRDERG